MRDINLHVLRCFDALLTERNVSRAAQRLEISQPAMSMALKKLREIFGDPLFVRGKDGMTVTARAQALHPRIKSAIHDLQMMLQSDGEFDPRKSKRAFTMILTDYIDIILMPRLLRTLEEAQAEVSFNVVGPNPFRIGSLFSEGVVDLTVSYFPEAPPNLLSRTVLFDRMTCLVRKGHPALDRPLTIEEFCRLEHINIEPGEATMYRALIDQAFNATGFKRRVMLSKPDFLGVPFVVAQSNFVAIMPARLAMLFKQQFGLATFEPPLDIGRIEIRMMWHETTHHSMPHRWLRDRIMAVCKILQDESWTDAT